MDNYYQKAVKILTSTEKFHIKLGLDRIGQILTLFDNPQNKIKIIHIAGTNGKGSCCSIINSILTAAGYKTGLFTSPHLVKYTERIKINSSEIPDDKFFEILSDVDNTAKKYQIYLTEFELLTAVGFIYFQKENVDFAIVEVGLGGQYDATNVIRKPFLTIITSISLDHTDRLGNTIEKIATEKAGIIKPNVECVVSNKNYALTTIEKIAKERSSNFITVDDNIKIFTQKGKTYANYKNYEYEFGLNGDYQSENLSLSLKAIEVLQKKSTSITNANIKDGLKKVTHNGRFEHIKKFNLIIDGAHNPDGAKKLRNSLNSLFPNLPINFIYACINTKDYSNILKTILTSKDKLVLYAFDNKNAVPTSVLQEKASSITNLIEVKNRDEIIKMIKANAYNNEITVLTGSLYAIGDLYPEIKKI